MQEAWAGAGKEHGCRATDGDPNNASWGNMPPELRGGGDAWIAGSYDPDLKLFFIGTSQAKPWVAASRGMSTNDSALYTNSTLALRPRTGEIVWHFQHVAGETIDMETGFERILVKLGRKKQLYTIGKDGILWWLDAKTGEFTGLAETQAQTIYAAIDRQRGQLQYREDIAGAGIGVFRALTAILYPEIHQPANGQALYVFALPE